MCMKNASAIFQRCMEHILKGIPGVVVYQDVTINEEIPKEWIEFLTHLGFTLSKAGIVSDKALIDSGFWVLYTITVALYPVFRSCARHYAR